MKLNRIPGKFSVCKLSSLEGIDFSREFVFLSKTDDEISLVCETDCVPPCAIAAEPNWQGLKIAGILDFGMLGVIAKIANLLAAANISIFVVSTYNTDYIFIKAENYEKTVAVLTQNGYVVA